MTGWYQGHQGLGGLGAAHQSLLQQIAQHQQQGQLGASYPTNIQQGVNHGIGPTIAQIHGHSPFQSGQYPGGAETHGPIERTASRWGEITGWRMWNIKDEYLISYSADHAWPPNEIMAGNPTESNNEGIWAFKTHSRALKKATEGNLCICGSVDLWGEIIEYSEGYRAQYAKIKSIDDAVGFKYIEKRKVIAILREHYAV